jgi:hypothetical protein
VSETEKPEVDEYVVNFYDGSIRDLTVPAGSRITFGPVSPKPIGASDKGERRPGWDRPPQFTAWCLRIYEDASKKILIGVFPNVHSFFRRGVVKLLRHEQEGGPLDWGGWDLDQDTDAEAMTAMMDPSEQPF